MYRSKEALANHHCLFCRCFIYNVVSHDGKAADSFWHATAITIGCVAINLSYLEQQRYNDLVAEDKELNDEYQTATSTEQLRQIDKKHDKNLELLDEYKKNIDTYNGILAATVIWEIYLWVFTDNRSQSSNQGTTNRNQLLPHVAVHPDWQRARYVVDLSWKF